MPGDYNPNGLILWEGPSRIDGSKVVVIATGLSGRSANAKTGDMVQTWILRADRDPLEALRTGADVSICGGCIHRPQEHDGEGWSGRSCYVNVAQAPLNVWRTWQRGRYARWDRDSARFRGRQVRLGSYGDPAAVPLDLWKDVLAEAAGWTGYTHQARSRRLRDVLEVCQLSADSAADALAARDAGQGSFRVLRPGEQPLEFEIRCPASAEAGYRLTCQECQMCQGRGSPQIAIDAHGIGAGMVPEARRGVQLPMAG